MILQWHIELYYNVAEPCHCIRIIFSLQFIHHDLISGYYLASM